MFRKLSTSTLSLNLLRQPYFWRRVAVLALIALLTLPATYYRSTQATQGQIMTSHMLSVLQQRRRSWRPARRSDRRRSRYSATPRGTERRR